MFTLTASDAAQSLQLARNGTTIEDQLGATGRKLLNAPKLARKYSPQRGGISKGSSRDHISNNTLNGWMGVLTTNSLRAQNSELKRKLERRDDPLTAWNPLQNITIPHMTRWKHTGVKYEDWTAAKGLHQVKGRQLLNDNQGVIKLCTGALPCGDGISGL